MEVPNSVLQQLDIHKVNYNVTNFPPRKSLKLVQTNDSSTLVKSLLVQDGQGRAQVLISADSILDVDAMFRQFGRKFEGVSSREIQPIFESEGLDNLPAIPNWKGLTTYIDTSLLKKNNCF